MTDRFTGLVPPLTPQEYSSLKAEILKYGRVLMPVVKDDRGVTIDGANRERIVDELRAEGHKIPDPVYVTMPGMSANEKRTLARSLNLARRHVTTEQRRQVIVDQLLDTPERSNNWIAQALGVSDTTVGTVRRELEASSQIGKMEKTVGADGRTRTASRPPAEDDVESTSCATQRAPGVLEQRDAEDVGPHEQLVLLCFVCDEAICSRHEVGRGGRLRHYACGSLSDHKCAWCGDKVARKDRHDERGTLYHEACWTETMPAEWHKCFACRKTIPYNQEAPQHRLSTGQTVRLHRRCDQRGFVCAGCARYLAFDAQFDRNLCVECHKTELASMRPVVKPVMVDGRKQLEKVVELAAADKMHLVHKKGVNGAHKQHREERRFAEMRDQVHATAPDTEVRIERADVFDMLREIGDDTIDMLWTDLPYNISGTGGGTKVGDAYETFDAGEWDDWDEAEFLEWLGRLVPEFARVLKPSGSLVACIDRVLVSHLWDRCKLRQVNAKVGLKPKNMLLWSKTNAAPNARGNFDSGFEQAVWAAKSTDYLFQRPRTGQCSNVWPGPFVSGPVREKYPHPTPKPIGWIQSHMEVLTLPGHLVLDPFGGSGSTMEAALRLGRRVITSDINPDYVAMMKTRHQDVLTELQAQPQGATA